MKKIISYVLLFAYSTMLLKPVLPFVTDMAAHLFWYSEHMATVHVEHGRYHVHYESLEAAKKAFPEKNTGLPKSQVTDNEHYVSNELFDFSVSGITKVLTGLSPLFLHSSYLTSDYPPPRF